jgi:hypothetical protein
MNRSRSLPAVIVPRPCVAAGTAVTFRLNARPKTKAAEHKRNRLYMKSALRGRLYRAVQPPSTMNICPSTYVDSGESRNTMVGASSSGPSILPRGVFSRIQRS